MRGSRIIWGAVVAACVVTAPAGATHRKIVHGKVAHSKAVHGKVTHHETSHRKVVSSHHTIAKHRGKDTHHASHPTRDDRKPLAAAGATTVPASGTKLYCGPGKSPLMVRKMTQGAGTSVTVICR